MYYINGYFIRKDGSAVVFLAKKEIPENIRKKIIQLTGAHEIEFKTDQITFMYMPIGVDGAVCSPPIGGYTCHHCVSPFENKDMTGKIVNLLDEEKLVPVDKIKIEKDFVFHPQGVIESFINSLLLLFRIKLFVNKYDFALVEKKMDIEKKKAGVLFAGTVSGNYAIFYDLANVPIRRDDIISLANIEKVTTYSLHIESKEMFGIIKREYTIEGKGTINIVGYGKIYTFEPVYFAKAEPTELCLKTTIRRRNRCIPISTSVKPGYSGSVALAD